MRKLIFLIIIFYSVKSWGQVNLPTGSATFSLPMFSWQDDKSSLSSVVQLDYNSGSGLKVNDIASNVGQGWNLLQGGVVTRMQVGEPDDQRAYIYSNPEQVEDIKKYPAGYLYATRNPVNGAPLDLTRYPTFKDKNHIYKQNNLVAEDRELDYFSFQFNGRNGLFVLNKNSYNSSTQTYAGALIGDSKIKIWCVVNNNLISQQIRTTIDAFYIKDEKGLTYKFQIHGLSKVLKTSYCDNNLIEQFSQPNFKGANVYHENSFDKNQLTNPWVIDSWYLYEIEDSLTHRKVTFTYNAPVTATNSAGTDISYYAGKDYSIISHKTSVTTTQTISKITYPDGHQVVFNYGNPRIDLSGDKALASVDILYQSRFLSKYVLNTSYFILNRYGIPVTPYQKSVSRLCLMSVKKIGVDLKGEEPPYLFDYYLGSSTSDDDIVPPPFFHMKDIWGYYNGHNSAGNTVNTPINIFDPLSKLSSFQVKGLCFLRNSVPSAIINPKSDYAKNGLLRQVIYPTGGALAYQYSQNTGSISGGGQTAVGGVHVSSTSVTDGGFSNGCGNPINTQYNYTLTTGGLSSLWGIETPINSITYINSFTPERRRWKYSFPIGECYFEYQYPGILSHEDKVSLTTTQQIVNVLSKVLNVVGIASQIKDIITFLGPTPAGPVALIIDAIIDLFVFALSCFSAPPTTNTTAIVYYNSAINAANPLPSQFKRVEIIQGAGSAGKTIQEFTSDDDYAVWSPENTNPTLSMKQRFAYWAYGLPKKTTVYNVSGNIITQNENVYDWSYALRSYANLHMGNPGYPSCKALVIKNSSQRNDQWRIPYSTFITDAISNNDLKAEIYQIYTGRVELSYSYERVFKPGSSTQYLETATGYYYDNLNYQLQSINTTQSNGDYITKKFTYNDDYDLGILASMTQKNIIGVPVSTSISVSNINKPSSYVSEKVTEYTAVNTGNIKPSRILEQRYSQPQLINSTSMYQGPGNANNPPYKVIQTFTYDGIGNLSGLKDEGNHIVTNIYDYNDKYVAASVINCDPIADKSAYTSFETSGMGGWQYTGSLAYNYSLGVTGNNSFVLSSSNTLTKSIGSTKFYILSFWATSPVTVTNSTVIKTVNNINQFVYYEYKIAPNIASVTISGNANIDELRLYPLNARMRTVTYDPLIGKTSECDENNRITYYEYDVQARLRFIKDENKNAVKMYEYNTVSKQAGCPSIFYSRGASEIFTKNTCSTGYIGSDVLFTVPANKYTSTISQYDADQKLQADINANGQNYANSNGTCIQLFTNVAKSQSFATQSCPVGSAGGSVLYSVSAGKYSSTISQTDANQLAQDEIDANGQANANMAGTAVCTITTAPDWEGDDTSPTQCQTNGHRLVLLKDINPNSSSYNQTQWVDEGINTVDCPTTMCITYKITVPNSVAANLYIQYLGCISGSIIIGNWNTQIVHDASDPQGQSTSATLCLKKPPVFRYGSTGNILIVPGIIITQIGNCN